MPRRPRPGPGGASSLAALAALGALGAFAPVARATGATFEAAARIEAGEHAAALAALGADKSPEASYLRGRALELAGERAGAAREYGRAAPGLPALSDEVYVLEGEALLATKQGSDARRAFVAALRRTRGRPSAYKERALVGAVQAAALGGECEAAARLLSDEGRAQEVAPRGAAWLAIAQCHERRGTQDPAAAREAAARYDRLRVFRPAGVAAEAAREGLGRLATRGVTPPVMALEEGLRAARSLRLAGRLEEAAARLATLRPASDGEARLVRFEQGELHHAAGRHAEALALFRALHDERPGEVGAEGYLRMAARSLQALGRTEEAARTLLDADRVARGPRRNGRDLWRAAELFLRARLAEPAAKAWLLLARREGRHRDAPRAFVRAIEAYLELGVPARARKVADALPGRWARRRVAWRVRFLGAWAAYRLGDRKDARRRFERLAASSRAPALDRARARYWLARLAEAESPAKGKTAYRALVADAPASFYADLATARLRALGEPVPALPPPPPAALPPAPPPPPEPPRRRPAALAAATREGLAGLARAHGKELPQLPRALALARLGLLREAAAALESARLDVDAARRRPRRVAAFGVAAASPALGPAAVRRRKGLRRLDRTAFALRLAPLHRGLGERALEARLLRRFGRTAEGRKARREGAFPRPYADLVTEAARLHGLPPTLLFAIMRQESAFRTDALSVVGARGLMQIMPRTGQRIAARRGETLERGALDEPALSLRYGAWYLRELLLKFKGQLPLAIAAYNGGPAAVSRWLDARGRALATDEFLEELSFTETRRYVRKVLRSMRTYDQALHGKPGAYVRAELDATYGDNVDF